MTASAAAPKAPRKPRTRKPRAAAVKATKTPVVQSPKRPSSAKLITRQRYVQDIQQRWAIHQYEVMMLANDLKKGYAASSSYAKDAYNRAFN